MLSSNAGKTTILHQMKASLGLTGDKISTIPTIGCNVEIVVHNKQKMKVTDMGGKESVSRKSIIFRHI